MSKYVDYIIVGQGIAGSLLGYNLMKAGKKIHIIDNDHAHSSTLVAAGLINPITGRKFVKSWMVDQLIAAARKIYSEIGILLAINAFSDVEILRALHTVSDENQWSLRMNDDQYSKYISYAADTGSYKGNIKLASRYGLIKGLRIHPGNVITALNKYFKSHDSISAEKLIYEELVFQKDSVTYKNISASKIIFCEGFQVTSNPFFNSLPIEPVKGEVLLIKIPDVKCDTVLRDKIFIIPIESDLYWVGSGYEWKFDNDHPTSAGKEKLINQLDEILKVPYQIESHLAGIRPSSRDRRPIIGSHPQYPQLYVHNGLGTKGSSLAPYWSEHLMLHLVKNEPISPEVDISRFEVSS